MSIGMFEMISNLDIPSGHWASLGYVQVPFPSDNRQILSVNATVFLHDSGQQRLISLLHESQYSIALVQV